MLLKTRKEKEVYNTWLGRSTGLMVRKDLAPWQLDIFSSTSQNTDQTKDISERRVKMSSSKDVSKGFVVSLSKGRKKGADPCGPM
jgi:hypothetical protein